MVNIPTANYALANNRGSYLSQGTIVIGLPVKHNLTDKEVIEFTADSITHEYIHHILKHLFPQEVTYLFDAIGDKLRRKSLTRKVFKCFGTVSVWEDAIKEDGFDRLLDEYWLDKSKVNKILKEGC